MFELLEGINIILRGGWSVVYDFLNWNVCSKRNLLKTNLIVNFCQTPWEENVSWWMAHMNFTYYCSCHGFAVTFCFLLAGGKTPDVNDRTFANVMRSSALDREKVFLFYCKKIILNRVELMEIWKLTKTNSHRNFLYIFLIWINILWKNYCIRKEFMETKLFTKNCIHFNFLIMDIYP